MPTSRHARFAQCDASKSKDYNKPETPQTANACVFTAFRSKIQYHAAIGAANTLLQQQQQQQTASVRADNFAMKHDATHH